MRHLLNALRLTILPIFLALFCVFADGMAGNYAGTYSSNSGGDGKVRLSIQKTADAWDCKLAFTVSDQPEISAQHVVCAVNGTMLKGHYEVESDGATSKIEFEAVMSGNSLEGTYNEVGPDGKSADSGKWKASAAH